MIERIPITDRASWLKWRRQTIGASEVAVVYGDPDIRAYKTPLQLALEKTGQIEEAGSTSLMKRGTFLEPAIIEYIKDAHPDWRIERPQVWLHDPETHLSATPDAIGYPEGDWIGEPIELKVIARPVFVKDWMHEDQPDSPPAMYGLQAMTTAMLWSAERAHIAALVIDTFSTELRMFKVDRHSGVEFRILARVRKFWENLEAGSMPAPDYGRDFDLIEQLYPPNMGHDILDLSGDNRLAEVLEQRDKAKHVAKCAQDDCKALDAEIIDKLRGSVHAVAGQWKITRNITHKRERIVPATSFPVLRVTERKGK